MKGVKEWVIGKKRRKLMTTTTNRKVREGINIERGGHNVDHRKARIRSFFLNMIQDIMITDFMKKRKKMLFRRDQTRTFKSAVVIFTGVKERKISPLLVSEKKRMRKIDFKTFVLFVKQIHEPIFPVR